MTRSSFDDWIIMIIATAEREQLLMLRRWVVSERRTLGELLLLLMMSSRLESKKKGRREERKLKNQREKEVREHHQILRLDHFHHNFFLVGKNWVSGLLLPYSSLRSLSSSPPFHLFQHVLLFCCYYLLVCQLESSQAPVRKFRQNGPHEEERKKIEEWTTGYKDVEKEKSFGEFFKSEALLIGLSDWLTECKKKRTEITSKRSKI